MSENEMPPLEQIAGYVGADPEKKPGYEGKEFTAVRLGVSQSYGEDSETKWYGVAFNNQDVQDFVNSGRIRKGTPIVVEGTTKEVVRDGVTYFNFNGYRVGIVDWFVIGRKVERNVEDEDL